VEEARFLAYGGIDCHTTESGNWLKEWKIYPQKIDTMGFVNWKCWEVVRMPKENCLLHAHETQRPLILKDADQWCCII
jgi:hypothetical protein